ncbi:hypothetical protein [Halomicrococcus sp. SG-WS-1]|uniref:hypothetical protein n=1 Tax=Halomicrococcus sp. SG-WS-1 TaxID=3439057 RepID=UPI003F7AD82A
MSANTFLSGTRTVDSARLWESTFWVVLGVLIVVTGRWVGASLGPPFGRIGFAVFGLFYLVSLVGGAFSVLKGLAVLGEALLDARATSEW